MTNNHHNLPAHIKKISIEATFRSGEGKDAYIYGYVTYDKSKIKGPQIEKTQRYNIQAYGRIPITENEILDMVLNTDKNDKMLDFHMTYIRTFTNKENTLLGGKFKQSMRLLNIRTDVGPHRDSPHIDVEVFDDDKNKVLDKVVKQGKDFPNYESAINAVFMQVERISNPLIGAQYWLSPSEIFPERPKQLELLRNQHKISTSLSVVARAINLKTYEETRTGTIVDEKQFWKMAESQLQLVKEKEKELGGEVDVSEIHYSTGMSVLPFLFFVPDCAEYSFKTYYSDGPEIPVEGKDIMGIVWERKGGINFIRDLGYNERDDSKNDH